MIYSIHHRALLAIERTKSALARSEGQALIEYALIVSVVGMLALGGLSLAGSGVGDLAGRISNGVAGVVQPGATNQQQTTQTSTTAPTTTATQTSPKRRRSH